MDQPEMNQTKQTDETDSVAAPVGRVGGRRPSTLSIGDDASSGAPETGPLGPGQRWSFARKRAVVLRLLRGEAPELVSQEIGVPVYKLERWLEKAKAALEDALKELEADASTELCPPRSSGSANSAWRTSSCARRWGRRQALWAAGGGGDG